MRPLSFLPLLLLPYLLTAQSIQPGIDAIVSDPLLAGASIGIDVMDLETGARIASHDPGRSLIPASTQKLITTGVALKLLGDDHRFPTRLKAQGRIENGVLYGDIIIVGGGDPTLGSPVMPAASRRDGLLKTFVAQIQAAGIQEVNGAVIGDDSHFGTAGVAMDWPWADLGNYYGAGSYGLNWHDNLYYLDLTQRQTLGSTPPIRGTRPNVPDLTIENELRTAARGSGDNAYIYGAPFNYRNFLRGTIPAGTGRFTIKGSLPDPARQAAHELEMALKAAGIDVTLPASGIGRARLIAPDGPELELYQHTSPTLLEIAQRTNFKSVNLYAETLLREINVANKVAVAENNTMQTLLDELENGLALNLEAVQLLDGSGLSPRNYFPAAFMTAYLRSMKDNESFLSTIPVAGRSGSMRNRLKGTSAEGRLYAKSGSLNGARCFAGYAFRADGKKLAFSIMINNYTADGRELNRMMNQFLLLLCQP
ncbi:D-alanyl-D-alanine carboxypeptidase/D-alanyl-D-alanine-endopeptidase [Lewinellaceae bacterium SD302]|nr:D-alanyl-D-alanine carboxypeptidase/D-alanyl-D-alanine-endopeptidase [Lewinellaceae bacterium SD302]